MLPHVYWDCALITLCGQKKFPINNSTDGRCEQWQYLTTLRSRCIVIGPVCGFVAVFLFLWICYRDNSKIACIDPHQTGFVGKGSDHLQLITFWPSCDGAKISGSALLQPACSVCVSLSAFSLPLRYRASDKNFAGSVILAEIWVPKSGDVILATRVLVSRHLEDKNESRGLGLGLGS